MFRVNLILGLNVSCIQLFLVSHSAMRDVNWKCDSSEIDLDYGGQARDFTAPALLSPPPSCACRPILKLLMFWAL
jgi:hypothetical protein